YPINFSFFSFTTTATPDIYTLSLQRRSSDLLYDLYAQYSRQSAKLERFGEDVFRNGTGNLDELPMDMPAGPDYVVGPGDGLTIKDRKSTRLNSSHLVISYAVFCLKKKKKTNK